MEFVLSFRHRTSDIYLFSYVLQKCQQTVCREPEIFKLEISSGSKKRPEEKAVGTAENLPFLQMPLLRPEGTCPQRKREDLHHLSQVQDGICTKKLNNQEVNCYDKSYCME